MRRFLAALACLLPAAPLAAQAVTQWQNAAGVAVAIVETPGGDLEHLAVVLPREAVVPVSLLGFPLDPGTARSHKVALLSVPGRLAHAGLVELSKAFDEVGFTAVVAVGPVSARELTPALQLVTASRGASAPAPQCTLADGGLEMLRGPVGSVELSFAAPPPTDPRFEMVPGVAGWIQRRLVGSYPGVRVDAATAGGCASIVVRVSADGEEPLVMLSRLRAAVSSLVLNEPGTDEVSEVQSQLDRRRLRWATDGKAVARELAERAAAGGALAGALVSPSLDAHSLSELAHTILLHHRGFARVVEVEKRSLGNQIESLDNGVQVTSRWLAGNAATVSLALGGLVAETAQGVVDCFAGRAADRGWYAEHAELVGIPAVAAVTPPGDLVEALETLAGCVVPLQGTAGDPQGEALAREIGLSPALAGSRLSIAIEVPGQTEEAVEAVAKFFAAVPPDIVSSQALHSGPALRWTVTAEPAHVVGVVDLPPTPMAMVAGQILIDRLRETTVCSARWLATPGHLVLLVEGSGAADLPALDAQLATLWQQARRPGEAEAVERAARRLAASLQGDLLRAAARRATSRFLPGLEPPDALLAVESRDVASVLAALPRWEELRRWARGPAPPQRSGAGRPAVRESAPRPQGR